MLNVARITSDGCEHIVMGLHIFETGNASIVACSDERCRIEKSK